MGFLLNRESTASYALQVVPQAAAQLVAGRLHPGAPPFGAKARPRARYLP